LTAAYIRRMYEMLCAMTPQQRYGVPPEPAPVKADSFDEWQRKTAALLEECQKRKR
jgi:hypothetical protein